MTQDELIEQVKKERRFRNRLKLYMKSLFSNWTATLGFFIIAGFYLTALLADFLAPHMWYEHNWALSYHPPSPLYPFGTDWAGQDVFSREIYGSRTAVLAGFNSIGAG